MEKNELGKINKILETQNFLVIAHSFGTGPPQELVKFLKKRVALVSYIDHPFFYSKDTRSSVTVYEKGEEKVKRYTFRIKGPEIFYYIKDFILTIYFGLKTKHKYDICIACDNLNAFSALLLKKLGIIKYVIYSAVDFTPVRFENYFLNTIYQIINKICCYHCDLIWNSAKGMIKGREEIGIKRALSSLQIIVPDGNNFDEIERYPFENINRHDLVFMGHLRENQGIHLIIEAMPEIIKRAPRAKLIIVGTGPLEQDLKNLVSELGLSGKVIFTGFMKDHSDLEKILAKCAIAIAPYVPNKDSFSYYSDVGKPKAYMACGLPVIITPVPRIAFEITSKKAGTLIQFNKKELVEAVIGLFKDDNLYKEYRENAIALAEKYKWSNIFERAFEESFKILGIAETKKTRVLVTISGLLPPAIEMTGLRIIYELCRTINQFPNIEVYILTSIFRFVDKNYLDWMEERRQKDNLNIFIINDKVYENTIFDFLKAKIIFLLKSQELNKKYHFDIVHDYSSAPIVFLFSFFYKKIMKKKIVFHTLCTSNKGWLGSLRFNWGIRYVDKVICASEYITKNLRGYTSSRYRNRIDYISLGIDSQRFVERGQNNFLRQKLNIPDDNKVLLFTGPLEDRKGAPVLARAAVRILAKTDKVNFIFACYGEGGLDRRHRTNKEKFLEIIKNHEDNISILEGSHNIPSLLASADIFVLPSVTSHGILAQPLTLLEAMAAGKAVVVSRIDGIEEIINHNVNGLLFENRNAEDLADKICELLNDDNYRLYLGVNAKNDIINRYKIDLSAKKLIENYGKSIK